jgi:1-phosphofructokinase
MTSPKPPDPGTQRSSRESLGAKPQAEVGEPQGEGVTVVTVTLNAAIDRLIEAPGLHIGGHVKGKLIRRVAAGKGINVSRALARLGAKSVATGFIGKADEALYEEELPHLGAANRLVVIPGHTRENITLIDPTTGVETHIRDAGLAIGPDDLKHLSATLSSLATGTCVMVFSGSLPPGLAAKEVESVIEAIQAPSVRIAFDGPGTLFRALAQEAVWLVKPNRQELSEWTGEALDSEAALIRTAGRLAQKIQHVLVSCGAEGAYLFAEGRVLRGRVAGDVPEVRSTVGCGDVILAAFLAARLQACSIDESLRRALAAATAATTHQIPGEFDSHDVWTFLSATQVEELTHCA